MSVNAWIQVACALTFFSTFAQSQVLDFPRYFRFIYVSPPASALTEDLKACHALVRSKITKGFFVYNRNNLNCTYGEAIYGFIYGDNNSTFYIENGALVSTSSTEVTSVNSIAAERYMMNEVYGSSECPVNTTSWGQWCATQKRVHGVYTAGRFRNGTMLVLSRTDVSISLNYSCDTPFSIRMIFGGKWYCYTRFDNIGALNYDTILTNRCASLQPGSSVIKLTEADRECGFLTENRAGYEVYLGLIQPNAVPKTAASYKYYDGSSAGTLPWATARPNVTDAKKNLVICDNVERGLYFDNHNNPYQHLFYNCDYDDNRSDDQHTHADDHNYHSDDHQDIRPYDDCHK
ncbi:hypothetical protein AAVH_26219 [Aphelenchoides avenae]|nr:hypothetical protein AAVH_26219 [Aphelenchus avenae]